MRTLEEQQNTIAEKQARMQASTNRIEAITLLNEILSDINALADQMWIEHTTKYPPAGKKSI